MPVEDTSTESFHSADVVSRRESYRRKTYDLLHADLTTTMNGRQIAASLNETTLNRVLPVISRMVTSGLLSKHETKKCPITNKRVWFYKGTGAPYTDGKGGDKKKQPRDLLSQARHVVALHNLRTPQVAEVESKLERMRALSVEDPTYKILRRALERNMESLKATTL